MVIKFNPSLVVNYATQNISLVRNFSLTYSTSSGEILSIDGPLGDVIIEDPIEVIEVCNTKLSVQRIMHSCIIALYSTCRGALVTTQ